MLVTTVGADRTIPFDCILHATERPYVPVGHEMLGMLPRRAVSPADDKVLCYGPGHRVHIVCADEIHERKTKSVIWTEHQKDATT